MDNARYKYCKSPSLCRVLLFQKGISPYFLPPKYIYFVSVFILFSISLHFLFQISFSIGFCPITKNIGVNV